MQNKELNNTEPIKQQIEKIDKLMEVFLGAKADKQSLITLSKYLKMNPNGTIDVKSLFQSIKRDNQIDDILNK